MPNPTPSPVRVAAVRAAIAEECIARAIVNECEPIACAKPCKWCRQGAMAALAAYERAMGRTIDAEQIERMR